MSLRKLTEGQAARLQEQAHFLEELAEELRARAVTFRAVQDTGISSTVSVLAERVENIVLIVQEGAQ
jgi:hypothetical protein